MIFQRQNERSNTCPVPTAESSKNLQEIDAGDRNVLVVFGSGGMLLLVFKVAALVRQRNQVGEDHPTEADMEERIGGQCFDVLLNVAVDRLVGCLLDVLPRKLRLQIIGHIPYLQPLVLVEESPQCH